MGSLSGFVLLGLFSEFLVWFCFIYYIPAFKLKIIQDARFWMGALAGKFSSVAALARSSVIGSLNPNGSEGSKPIRLLIYCHVVHIVCYSLRLIDNYVIRVARVVRVANVARVESCESSEGSKSSKGGQGSESCEGSESYKSSESREGGESCQSARVASAV